MILRVGQLRSGFYTNTSLGRDSGETNKITTPQVHHNAIGWRRWHFWKEVAKPREDTI
jgi:hypothetical protein